MLLLFYFSIKKSDHLVLIINPCRVGYGISMLMHLAEGFPDAVAKLTMQYRMNVDICHFSNLVAYKGLLKCGNETVANQRLRLPIKPKLEMNHNKQWIEKVINPNNPVVFLDCAAEEIVGPVNSAEVSIVEECIRSLSACGLSMSSIGVITPFRSQVRERDYVFASILSVLIYIISTNVFVFLLHSLYNIATCSERESFPS